MKAVAELKNLGNGQFALTGELDFDSVSKLADASFLKNVSEDKICLDLSGVTLSNSAGVALLLEWLRRARESNVALFLENIPDKMVTIADFSGVRNMLSSTPQ